LLAARTGREARVTARFAPDAIIEQVILRARDAAARLDGTSRGEALARALSAQTREAERSRHCGEQASTLMVAVLATFAICEEVLPAETYRAQRRLCALTGTDDAEVEGTIRNSV
jgi:hypothetical protein